MMKVSSPLRYPGGKTRALSKIRPFIPLDFSEYREPFLGGGSVFIALKQLRPNAKFRVNDLNHDLYCFWSVVKGNVDELIQEILGIRKRFRNGSALYKRLTCSENASDDFHLAVRFYILNRITYSGTIDSGGYSNQAFEKRFTLSNVGKLRPLSDFLQNVEITNESYENLLFEPGKDVFIYMDPPYWKSRKSKLYGKNGDLHKSFNHWRFAENVRKCEHRWLITYDNSEVIRKLFRFANVHPWRMQYAMNNVGGKRTDKGKELFLTNYVIEKGSRRRRDPSYSNLPTKTSTMGALML
jgi:DNA adenine methylase